MAKRRKLEAPSAEDLSRIEEEFRRETSKGIVNAPIAQVAAETAALHETRSAQDRAAAAKDRSDAERLRAAEKGGLVMLEVPLSEIRRDAIVRDRVVIDAAELEELKLSIMKTGLRLPIEVFPLEEGAFRYGLLSGYRRLMAMQQLSDYFGGEKHATIKAVVRDPQAMGGTFAAMVEENEIRASLSHFERGRIAVIAAQQGAFVNTEEAVNALFPQASKAKRSKIRSFALIFEELGDMLSFPDMLKERDGLRMAAALREGAEGRLRDALAEGRVETPEEEAALIAEALDGVERKADPKKGGRPKKVASPRVLDNGVRFQAGEDANGWYIRLSGRAVGRDTIDVAMNELERIFGPPSR
ncbi:ParB/RepB/Spo0J family partition protein [Sagittula salina]|uniref:ParB N-terminal domain-containing protein n=1 Tax=Sagittula salina TaxID=2820268 RepID=A0A940S3C2_9RHOB|nr:ParB/RepB/Spo0J family partition protein [Sagittula salina]MBP0484952.1 ParB N-terminal domain-containing protein [Sagittula salina]